MHRFSPHAPPTQNLAFPGPRASRGKPSRTTGRAAITPRFVAAIDDPLRALAAEVAIAAVPSSPVKPPVDVRGRRGPARRAAFRQAPR